MNLAPEIVDQYVARMEAIAVQDQETSHIEGDDLLEEIIRAHLPELEPVLTAYDMCGKWYA